MSAHDNGGPAFPLVAEGHEHVLSIGVTLRDYFAAKALPVAMAMMERDFNNDLGAEWAWNRLEREMCAEHAYELADLMLAARNGGAA